MCRICTTKTSAGQKKATAYLEHFRHAAPILSKLVELHGLKSWPPDSGLVIVVHARYDTEDSPPDTVQVVNCSAAARPAEFHLFNYMGLWYRGVSLRRVAAAQQ